jgi:hypothetical protein
LKVYQDNDNRDVETIQLLKSNYIHINETKNKNNQPKQINNNDLTLDDNIDNNNINNNIISNSSPSIRKDDKANSSNQKNYSVRGTLDTKQPTGNKVITTTTPTVTKTVSYNKQQRIETNRTYNNPNTRKFNRPYRTIQFQNLNK